MRRIATLLVTVIVAVTSLNVLGVASATATDMSLTKENVQKRLCIGSKRPGRVCDIHNFFYGQSANGTLFVGYTVPIPQRPTCAQFRVRRGYYIQFDDHGVMRGPASRERRVGPTCYAEIYAAGIEQLPVSNARMMSLPGRTPAEDCSNTVVTLGYGIRARNIADCGDTLPTCTQVENGQGLIVREDGQLSSECVLPAETPVATPNATTTYPTNYALRIISGVTCGSTAGVTFAFVITEPIPPNSEVNAGDGGCIENSDDNVFGFTAFIGNMSVHVHARMTTGEYDGMSRLLLHVTGKPGPASPMTQELVAESNPDDNLTCSNEHGTIEYTWSVYDDVSDNDGFSVEVLANDVICSESAQG